MHWYHITAFPHSTFLWYWCSIASPRASWKLSSSIFLLGLFSALNSLLWRSLGHEKTSSHQLVCSSRKETARSPDCSAPNNTQLWVYFIQISILMQRCQAFASCWRMHIFSDRDDQQRVRKQCKVQKAKPHLPYQILICNADWLKCHFRRSIPMLTDWKFTFFPHYLYRFAITVNLAEECEHVLRHNIW